MPDGKVAALCRSRLRVDVYPLLLRVSMCYRSVVIAPENRDLPFLISCKMGLESELADRLCQYFLPGQAEGRSQRVQTRFWCMRSSRRGGGPPQRPLMFGERAEGGAGGKEVGAGEGRGVTPGGAGQVGGTGGAVISSYPRPGKGGSGLEKWEKVDPSKCKDGLASLGLRHNDKLLMEVKEAPGGSGG